MNFQTWVVFTFFSLVAGAPIPGNKKFTAKDLGCGANETFSTCHEESEHLCAGTRFGGSTISFQLMPEFDHMIPEHQRKENEKDEWRIYALEHTVSGDCWYGCKCSKNFYRDLDTKKCINIEDCYKSKFIPSALETIAYSYDSSNNKSLTEITN